MLSPAKQHQGHHKHPGRNEEVPSPEASTGSQVLSTSASDVCLQNDQAKFSAPMPVVLREDT